MSAAYRQPEPNGCQTGAENSHSAPIGDPGLAAELDRDGCASLGTVLTPAECGRLVEGYADDARFRSTVDMARHRYGLGEYRYFAYPLPEVVERLRREWYPLLLPIARDWAGRLRWESPWPDSLDDWLEMCHRAGQTRPTPLMLSYREGDWNALHRDLYGDLVFPLQVVVGLSEPGTDFTGGEFLMVEQRPRAQSRGISRTLGLGEGLVFTTRERPVRSTRGWSRAPMRHGVSEVRSGRRHTLGVIFHDAT